MLQKLASGSPETPQIKSGLIIIIIKKKTERETETETNA